METLFWGGSCDVCKFQCQETNKYNDGCFVSSNERFFIYMNIGVESLDYAESQTFLCTFKFKHINYLENKTVNS